MANQQLNNTFIPDFFREVENLHDFLHTAELGIWEVKLDSNTVSWDDRCRELFGIAQGNNLSYFDAVKFIHADDVVGVNRAVNDALQGVNNGKYNMTYRTIGADDGILRWVNFIGQAKFDSQGKALAFAGIARNISQSILNEELRRTHKENEENLTSLFEQAPMAIGVLKTRNMVLESGNERIFDVWGRDRSSIGNPIVDFLPEIKDQGFIELLEGVYDSGKPFYGYAVNVKLYRKGNLEDVYFDFVYAPLRAVNGTISGVIILALDVTNQVQARKKIEETETNLRGAVELAELGTWSIDLLTGILDYSPRLRKWFGFGKEEIITLDKAYDAIAQEYRPRVEEAMLRAIAAEPNFKYDIEYKVNALHTKRERIIHAQGQVHFDEMGKAYKVTGTAQDVTTQKHLQTALEYEVQTRTEELAASNEELVSTNEELSETNESLMTSNDELKQYAYVASHDLQEPLRKIRIFTDKLIQNKAQGSDTLYLLGKINNASERLTLLIKNVLEFSSLLKQQEQKHIFNLNEIFTNVVSDFDLLIDEKSAKIACAHLPSIECSEIQIHQLFLNLLSNALKFTRPNVHPRINIECEQLDFSEIKKYVSIPVKHATYYQLRFTDNGIGLDAEYNERIFEIFKRLHGLADFAGSGIGLALCKRIVTNHHGSITVESELGSGTTFNVFLPDKQKTQ